VCDEHNTRVWMEVTDEQRRDVILDKEACAAIRFYEAKLFLCTLLLPSPVACKEKDQHIVRAKIVTQNEEFRQ